MSELTFQVEHDLEDGGYVAFADTQSGRITTQGETLEELKEMILDAIHGYFIDKPEEMPKSIRLHFEEILAVA